MIIDVPEVQGVYIVWPGDHIIDWVTESYGSGDFINATGDVTIKNGGKLVLDGATLNMTFGSLFIGNESAGSLEIIGGS